MLAQVRQENVTCSCSLCLPPSHLQISRLSKDTHLPTSANKENPWPRTTVETKLDRRKQLYQTTYTGVGLTGGALVQPARAQPERPEEATSSRLSYSRFLEYLDEDAVKKVDLFENGTVAIAEIYNPALNKIQRVKVQLPGLPTELLRKRKEKGVDFAAHPMEMNMAAAILDWLGNLAFPLILLGILLLRTSSGNTPGGPNLPFGLGRSKAKFQMEPNTGVTFDDVAGVDEAKQDFQEIVEFLKTPEKFAAVGARIPKGVLLVGPTGTGKTLLAKAIGGQAGVPFYSLSGSEFIEMFVGVGASRVRDLFNKAKMNSPCLIFIDEIDAVGRQRGTGIGGGNDEREQTLNQLLTEMDGREDSTDKTLTQGHDPVQKVTLIPRGQARGLTWFIPGEDPALISKQQLFARIVGGLGGRAAEEVIFGEPEITTGAAGDLQQTTQIARQSSDVVLRMLARNSMSEKLAEDIDKSVRQIIDSAYAIAKKHIKENREAIDKLVEVLLEKETLTGGEFRAILSEFSVVPLDMISNNSIRKMIEA
ncbi:hypothetical protein RJ639_042576 [Escallonia herrerae]|uniref:AAA+ ATPase domain-containing protein n=1 Tax=Escallonia herrerae TaxID=1293975 RepID=A0AA88WFN7_9ASTE|nr:hypothetical protein RJ639_042576 [Escallonia herrerae]